MASFKLFVIAFLMNLSFTNMINTCSASRRPTPRPRGPRVPIVVHRRLPHHHRYQREPEPQSPSILPQPLIHTNPNAMPPFSLRSHNPEDPNAPTIPTVMPPFSMQPNNPVPNDPIVPTAMPPSMESDNPIPTDPIVPTAMSPDSVESDYPSIDPVPTDPTAPAAMAPIFPNSVSPPSKTPSFSTNGVVPSLFPFFFPPPSQSTATPSP